VSDGAFALLRSTNLFTGPWQILTNIPAVLNGLYRFELPVSSGNEFFKVTKLP